MLQSKRKKHVIFFRVTSDELASLQSVCSSIGARSVSEVARIAVRQLLGRGTSQPQTLVQQMTSLREAILDLDCQIQCIAVSIELDRRSSNSSQDKQRLTENADVTS
jgi:hypothetical protein